MIDRAVGATLCKVIDQRLLGQGSDVVETGRVDKFRLTNAGEGDAIAQLYGRMRVGGQVISASDFIENVTTSVSGGGGKGAPRQPTTTTKSYSYSVSLAIVLCEGEITSVGRVWVDGDEIAPDDLNMRAYTGCVDQQPDAAMEAIEGAGQVPAYRGAAYVVLEGVALEPFGNRVPQFSFEVIRAEQHDSAGAEDEITRAVKAVAMIPGTGEYALATTPVYYSNGATSGWSANVHSSAGKTDFATSLQALDNELRNSEAGSLIVSWFGDDLRCGSCTVRPKVEQHELDGDNMPWVVAGLLRGNAQLIARKEGRPVYRGTPYDASVVEAIRAMKAAGKAVMFYPFILMDQGRVTLCPIHTAMRWASRNSPGVGGSQHPRRLDKPVALMGLQPRRLRWMRFLAAHKRLIFLSKRGALFTQALMSGACRALFCIMLPFALWLVEWRHSVSARKCVV